MKEIKVEFHRFNNFVYGRVLSMPEELRGTGKITSNIMAGESYEIYSNLSPYLCVRKLFLMGTKEYDNNYFGWTYKTLEEAQLTISNFEKLIKKWNAEHRGILDDVEKEYLAAVIKPFKKNVRYLSKKRDAIMQEYLQIVFDNGNAMTFPTFPAGTMYKGMEVFTVYKLKELGLE